ncbi:L,D-transpeptidase family protein [Mycolicibacterium fallax]|uniref:L,D-TPase catalytic domain-containing protein n=1 Tax=Mycolicibacterium fallax TaxID=1793 RepID=A0A1X1RG83_MYCFA|nr:L,D-transpeptidase family protein [Mycolicibacterium fallax]HSA39153.1 hypothetical protein [Mycobacterium sp.]ORV05289.1 hypothetical protein AWC04_07020 [Mycolicibacterium fallax]ORV05304.1 hypothetical protein AWC04_07125 [Mycolicibacterium fallax]BBY98939.1 hypothetical protein MFAL_24060 [Mycolicibacterium fallax]HOW95602.1 hypothetical protein [Mycolicibacterium fallax]
MRRLVDLCCAVAGALVIALVVVAPGYAAGPWFGGQVGNATQVISVVGTGGSNATVDLWQRGPAGWAPVGAGIPAKVGGQGISRNTFEGSGATPMGIFTLNSAFGTKPNPGSGLPYVQVGPQHWWVGDVNSPLYNTMAVCAPADCPFSTAAPTENLDIPVYAQAVVMGVNAARTPGKGSAFFLHDTDGGPTAGCVAIDPGMLTKIIGWLRPGALIAISK